MANPIEATKFYVNRNMKKLRDFLFKCTKKELISFIFNTQEQTGQKVSTISSIAYEQLMYAYYKEKKKRPDLQPKMKLALKHLLRGDLKNLKTVMSGYSKLELLGLIYHLSTTTVNVRIPDRVELLFKSINTKR